MRFWQKVYLCVIILFIIGFDASVYLTLEKSYSLALGRDIKNAINEHHMIRASLSERLLSVKGDYTDFNTYNLSFLMNPYAEYYRNQQVYFELTQNGTPLFTNFVEPYDMVSVPALGPGEVRYEMREQNGVPYLFVVGFLGEDFSDYQFVYIRNEQSLKDYKRELVTYGLAVCITVSIALSAVIILLLLKLTAPLRRLNKAAKEIADGNYKKRVAVKSSDEVGEFSESFNRMAESVQAHVRKLFEQSETRKRFADSLAHELRTPVTAIMGYGEFLKTANLHANEAVMALDYIVSQSERLMNMSVKLLNLTSLSERIVSAEKVRLEDVIHSIRCTLNEQLYEKNLDLTAELRKTCLTTDKDLLETLLQNLIENAVHAAPTGGNVSIISYDSEDGTVIEIIDNGVGIGENELRRITEPFYRVDKSRSRASGGVGLGLAICRQICGAIRAELNFSSELGKGTKVTLHFTTFLQIDEDSVI